MLDRITFLYQHGKNIVAFTSYLMIFSTAAPVDKILDEDQDNLDGAGMWFVLQLTTPILYIRHKVIWTGLCEFQIMCRKYWIWNLWGKLVKYLNQSIYLYVKVVEFQENTGYDEPYLMWSSRMSSVIRRYKGDTICKTFNCCKSESITNQFYGVFHMNFKKYNFR